jgi:hypothetical protein
MEMNTHYVSNPCKDGTDNWYVWNMRDIGEMPRFVGSMEDCGLVADALNGQRFPASKLGQPDYHKKRGGGILRISRPSGEARFLSFWERLAFRFGARP